MIFRYQVAIEFKRDWQVRAKVGGFGEESELDPWNRWAMSNRLSFFLLIILYKGNIVVYTEGIWLLILLWPLKLIDEKKQQTLREKVLHWECCFIQVSWNYWSPRRTFDSTSRNIYIRHESFRWITCHWWNYLIASRVYFFWQIKLIFFSVAVWQLGFKWCAGKSWSVWIQ